MREIDLVPADYARARQTRRLLARCAAAIALLLLAACGGRAWLALRLAEERAWAAQAQRQDAHAAAQRAQLARLQADVDAADGRLAALRALRDATPGQAWWQAVDAAYGEKIWLDAVAYARRPAAPAPAAGGAAARPAAAWLEHVVELRGHALDHAAVAEFRRALAEQPQVTGVRLGDTALQPYGDREVVGFTIAATLAAGALPPAAPREVAP